MPKNLLEILEENSIKVIPRGERWVTNCPLHEGDRSPSFTVYPDLTYYCFGCKAWGDSVKFLMDYKGMPYELALEYAGYPERRERPVKRVIKVAHTSQIYSYLYDISEIYHRFLLNTPGALNYLNNRGLTHETISKYRLGFTDGGLIDPKTATDYGFARESNIISEDRDSKNYWETLSHRITIPNTLPGNLVDFIMGRTVVKSNAKYLGLRIPKPIYGLTEASDSPILFLVEGHFDWLVLKQWGYPAIVVGGTNIPLYNLPALRSRQVVIVPDNDKAGIKAADTLHQKLPNSLILDYKSLGVKDIGELVLDTSGKSKFEYEVRKQVPWLLNLSPKTLEKWFQSLNPYPALLLT